jgi:hypothetical protein
MRLIVATVLLMTDNTFSCQAPPTEPVVTACPGNSVSLHAVSSQAPFFTWSPACGMALLTVFEESGGGVVWTVYSRNSAADNPISSGIRYGRTPMNASALNGPAELQSGVAYQVQVSRMICDRGEPCRLVPAGEARFQL